jgi:hypothetical protein
LIATLAGVVLMTVGVKALVDSHRFLAMAVSTDGAVTFVRREVRYECHGQQPCQDETYPHPTVRFVTADEKVVIFEGDDGTVRTGDPVKVLYNRANPEDARLDNWCSRWGTAAVVGSGGLVLLVVGTTWLALHRRRTLRQAQRRGGNQPLAKGDGL